MRSKKAKGGSSYRRSKSKYGLEACEIWALKWKEEILTGTMLIFDPSCISSTSLPGWAIFRSGEMDEAGIIEGPVSADLPKRLQYLGHCVRTEFTEIPDILVVEKLSSSRTRILTSTMEARGAIIGNLTCARVIEIDPSAWRAYTALRYKRLGGNDYYTEALKDDDQDAIEMGRCIVWLAQGRPDLKGDGT